ncbi:hypothetical protein HY772_04440 [Candidatus Woesearchaeota archaeon]|nr:hypothetical protein [Candidatus Woesearchaeota archaeon]
MSLKEIEETVDRIKCDVEELKARPLSTSRPVLYLIAGVAMFSSCSTCVTADKLLKNQQEMLKLHERNVLGGPAPEKFYEINGHHAYIEIDGQPVENYNGAQK